ncbi:MAG: tetratricopeptide repeat protein [Elusimicrobia bacterium]|nr:tetratricopeptide repeat protein [Elusimicrobiota bacterium]
MVDRSEQNETGGFDRGSLYFEEACECERKGKYDEAVVNLKKAIEHGYDAAHGYRDIGRICRDRGRREQAVKELTRAVNAGVDSPGIRIELGRVYSDQGRYEEALIEFRKAMESDPCLPEVYDEMGSVYERAGEYAKTAQMFERALEGGLDNYEMRVKLGRTYYRQGKYDSALNEFKRAEEFSPARPDIYKEQAAAYEAAGEYDEALKSMKKAISGGLENADMHRDMGRIYCKKGELDLSAEEFSKAVNAASGNAAFRAELGRVYCMQGLYDKAEKEILSALEKEPENAGYKMSLGDLYINKREYEKAIKELSEAAKIDPGCGQINAMLSQAYKYCSDRESSRRELMKARDKGYEDEITSIRLGEIYRDEGEYGLALRQFSKASEITRRKGSLQLQNKILNEKEIAQEKTILESMPLGLAVCLTNKCNLRCIMCDVWQTPAELSAKIVAEIRDLFRYAVLVSWLGGEAFMSGAFRGMFEYASSFEELKQCIITNGLLIDEDWAALVMNTNTDLVISIDSVRKNTYEKIRAGAKFEDLLAKLELINKYRNTDGEKPRAGKKLTMQLVLLKENYRELDEVMEFMKKHGMNKLQILPLKNSIGDGNSFYLDRGVRDTVSRSLGYMKEQADEYGIELASGLPVVKDDGVPDSEDAAGRENRPEDAAKEQKCSPPICLLPWQLMNIDARGIVNSYCFCPEYKIGDANKNTLAEIWNSQKMSALRGEMLEKGHLSICNPSCIDGMIPPGELRVEYK